MKRERGEGRGGKNAKAKEKEKEKSPDGKLEVDNLGQLEYLLYQSTQGIHFMFDNSDIARVLRTPSDEVGFFTEENMKKVQSLLSGLLGCETINAKQSFLERLPGDDFDLLVRAYFHLVENTILAHSNIRH